MRHFIATALLSAGLLAGVTATASAAGQSTTFEPVTASSQNDGQVTFTDSSIAATVNYGLDAGSMVYTITLIPNQVVTVSLGDNTETVYWQASSTYGTGTVHKVDTSDPLDALFLGVMIGLIIVCFVAFFIAIACS